MAPIQRIAHVSDYNALRGVSTLHPLVSVIDLHGTREIPPCTFHFGVYAVFLKELHCGDLRYGRNHYDYQEGTLVFFGLGQVVGVQPKPEHYQTQGWALLFHPDLIRGTPLGKNIAEYNFFSYEVHEALHLSEKEKAFVIDCFRKIQYELEQGIDKHSRRLIAANIELFLQYCSRFYDRQFFTRDHTHKGILEKLEGLLHQYFLSDKPHQLGIPSVAYCATELHVSAGYLGDLVRKETGRSAQEYIQNHIIHLAKEQVLNPDQSISEVAYQLGFKYPQHFTRLFKQKTGMSPLEYRSMN
jgi:AraC family transcriptional regulator, transcriptional activator of pobA